MPYIGRGTDKLSNVEVLDNITFDGSSSYTLQKGGSNFTPSSANNILISIDGVVQAGNFTVSGSTIDFGTAVAGTSTCDFILHYGVGLITTPSDGTVTTAKLADSSVSLAKLTATGTKNATTFLRGDNTFAEVVSGITEADQWRLTANLNFSSSITPITANLERSDTAGFNYIGTGMTESSGVFTFPSTGIWMIMIQAMVAGNGAAADYASVHFQTTQNNGSSYTNQVCQIVNQIARTGGYANGFGVSFFDVTNTSTHKCRFGQDAQSTTCQLWGDTNIQSTGFTFIRLGDT